MLYLVKERLGAYLLRDGAEVALRRGQGRVAPASKNQQQLLNLSAGTNAVTEETGPQSPEAAVSPAGTISSRSGAARGLTISTTLKAEEAPC